MSQTERNPRKLSKMNNFLDSLKEDFMNIHRENEKEKKQRHEKLKFLSKWDYWFINLARHVSQWSIDPSVKVGSVIVNRKIKQVLSVGFNGFPRGFDDNIKNYKDVEVKNTNIVHSESNAIFNALEIGVKISDCDIYVFGLPVCFECAKALCQTKIARVVSLYPKKKIEDERSTWIEKGKISESLFKMSGIKYVQLNLLSVGKTESINKNNIELLSVLNQE